jgi:transcription elongation factor GreA-like protein
VIQLICLELGEFTSELRNDEIVGLAAVSMIKYKRMAQVYHIWKKIINRKNTFDFFFALAVDISTKNDGRFTQVRSLP